VYATLSRLEEQGYLRSWQGDSPARRGGRSKRHYGIEPSGVRALEATRRMLDQMWDGVDIGTRPGRA
jgi:DNA-binding PadR family transcriptional regulator